MTTNVYWFGVAAGLVLIVLVAELVRRRYLRGRFAAVWTALGAGAVAVALFPSLLDAAARLVGVRIPLNLLLFCACLAILVMIIQLSAEAGRTNDKIRVLAEEVAMLRAQLDRPRDSAPKRVGQSRECDPRAETLNSKL